MDLTWFQTTATFLWCYALVNLVAWVRAVRAEALNTHIGHFVGLCGVMVPFIAGTLLVVVAGGLLGWPWGPLLGLLFVPGGLFAALQLELNRIRPATVRTELVRLAMTVALAALFPGGLTA